MGGEAMGSVPEAMGSVPYYLHLSRIRSTNSFRSPRSSASRQNRFTPCAREPYSTPGRSNQHPPRLLRILGRFPDQPFRVNGEKWWMTEETVTHATHGG